MPGKVSAFGACGPTFVTRDNLWAYERCINWYPSIDPTDHAKSKISLTPCPGLVNFLDVPGSSPPLRGLFAGDNKLFAVCGGQFFELFAGGTTTLRGSIASAQTPVQFAASGTSVLIATGDSIWRNDGGTTCVKVLDAAHSVVYLDGYYIALKTGTINPADANYIQLSTLADDGAVWDPDMSKMAGKPDRGTQLRVHEGNLWIFGSRTIQVWYHAGDVNNPFMPVMSGFLDIGTDYPWTIAQIDKHLYFLGFDATGTGRVYRTDGYTPVKISNEAIEYLISTYLDPLTGADPMTTGYGYTEDGHTFYVLSFPKSAACLVYDLTTGMWHERYRWDGTAYVQWKGAGFHAFVFGRHFVARGLNAPFPDPDSKRVYWMDIRGGREDGQAIRRQRIAPWVAADQQWLFHHYLRLYVGANDGVQVFMRYLKDGGEAWSAAKVASTFRHEVEFRRLGRARDRLYDISVIDDDTRSTIVEAYLHASPGIQR